MIRVRCDFVPLVNLCGQTNCLQLFIEVVHALYQHHKSCFGSLAVARNGKLPKQARCPLCFGDASSA
jgi:hypothetical protein